MAKNWLRRRQILTKINSVLHACRLRKNIRDLLRLSGAGGCYVTTCDLLNKLEKISGRLTARISVNDRLLGKWLVGDFPGSGCQGAVTVSHSCQLRKLWIGLVQLAVRLSKHDAVISRHGLAGRRDNHADGGMCHFASCARGAKIRLHLK